MAGKKKGGEGISQDIDVSGFVGYLKKEKIDELKKLGAGEILDFLMEALDYRDRGANPKHILFSAYRSFKEAFLAAPYDTPWVLHSISCLIAIGFTHAEIRDAFAWYFSRDHKEAFTHPEDDENIIRIQDCIAKAFKSKQWASPFRKLS